ncbi:ATP-binding cassette domain-containing protein [Tessaracoccus sp. OS52]|uniref:ATP-binding cassette domain-containing protein n=1 Tax=Tessaracoccus sp. OS52 TaxID=2886691 RepID=UPI001D127B9A|nr:ATP-binding cassette domain-containing protein [Tessaracoccus sp. OS52]MCC2594473.1 ATP-binding cassette domain-containing protein [Tessaracoccus sp. OS52]
MTVDLRWSRTPSNWAVQTADLTKSFGRTVAVAGLDLHVPEGAVHGLLGPNGSGKTTTLRMLLGLVRADHGRMELLGKEVPKHLPEVINKVGAIVESPKFYPSMTLRRNLEVLAMSLGVCRRRVTEVLLEVGLGGRGDTRFQQCSLGMKQRLAIAATLLKEPQLLIFDEPTNGLDPAGIHEIRTTIRALADAGRTVLVSSHDLSEIEQVADSVSVIGRGRVIAEGELAEFLSGDGACVEVEVDNLPLAAEALRRAGFQSAAVGARLQVSCRAGERADPRKVAKVLADVDLWPSHLVLARTTLEQAYLDLTADEHLTATQGRSGTPRPRRFGRTGAVS